MRKIKHKLARLYFYFGAWANVFRLHEMNFLKKHIEISRNDGIIDIACGIGVFTNSLSKRARSIIGLDLSFNSILIANHFKYGNMCFYQGNAEYLGHRDESFDSVISICALEHFCDSEKSLREMFRILRPGGQLLITVDSFATINDPEFVKFHKKFCVVEKYFTAETIRNELREAGFEIDIVKPLMTSPFSAYICRLAFRIMKWPHLFNIYSIVAYPMTLIAEAFSGNNREGIIIGVYAHKPKFCGSIGRI
jgi:2-polyprenyl-3-methyl-5-hydroxy-6-metoxy-1,4-benzoquinol methylase